MTTTMAINGIITDDKQLIKKLQLHMKQMKSPVLPSSSVSITKIKEPFFKNNGKK